MLIEAKNLCKQYGDNNVLENLNLSVEQGEFVTMVGTSGCGKSTFLNLLLGSESATSGSLLIDGETVPAEPSQDRGIVFQQYSVFPHLSVLNNVVAASAFSKKSISGLLFGAEKKAAIDQAKTILDKVGLGHCLKLYPHELSGGMKQRLAIAQALFGKPRVLLLDEPFGALDPGIRADMHRLVLELWQENQLTVFMVTHDLKEGFYLGTRLCVFDKIRHDPQAPNAFGARITYDLPVGNMSKNVYEDIDNDLRPVSQTELMP